MLKLETIEPERTIGTMSSEAELARGETRDVSVLVVDDQQLYRDVLRTVVERAQGFSVVGEVCCGEEAAGAVASLSPQIVLMDIRMPGIGGIAAAREILDRRRAPLVVLTSVDEAALESGAASLGPRVARCRKQDLLPARLRELWERHRN